MQVRSTMVYACPDADYSMPMKSAIKDKHLELVRLVEGQTYVCTCLDRRHDMRKKCFGLH